MFRRIGVATLLSRRHIEMSLHREGTRIAAVSQIVTIRGNAVVEGDPISLAFVSLFATCADFEYFDVEIFATIFLNRQSYCAFVIVRDVCPTYFLPVI